MRMIKKYLKKYIFPEERQKDWYWYNSRIIKYQKKKKKKKEKKEIS